MLNLFGILLFMIYIFLGVCSFEGIKKIKLHCSCNPTSLVTKIYDLYYIAFYVIEPIEYIISHLVIPLQY